MSERAEALAQLSRLLGDASLRAAPDDALRRAVSSSLDRLADSLVAEAAASDDVFDRDSAQAYLDHRLAFLAAAVDDDQLNALQQAVTGRIAQW